MKDMSQKIKDELLLALSKEIRYLIANGYTQKYIAKIARITQPLVSKLQTNMGMHGVLSIDRIIDIFSRLGKSVILDTSQLIVIVF